MRPSILQDRSIGERILDKMKKFVEVFINGMTAYMNRFYLVEL